MFKTEDFENLDKLLSRECTINKYGNKASSKDVQLFTCSSCYSHDQPICFDCKEQCHKNCNTAKMTTNIIQNFICNCGLNYHIISNEDNYVSSNLCYGEMRELIPNGHKLFQRTSENKKRKLESSTAQFCIFCVYYCQSQQEYGSDISDNYKEVDQSQASSCGCTNHNHEKIENKLNIIGYLIDHINGGKKNQSSVKMYKFIAYLLSEKILDILHNKHKEIINYDTSIDELYFTVADYIEKVSKYIDLVYVAEDPNVVKVSKFENVKIAIRQPIDKSEASSVNVLKYIHTTMSLFRRLNLKNIITHKFICFCVDGDNLNAGHRYLLQSEFFESNTKINEELISVLNVKNDEFLDFLLTDIPLLIKNNLYGNTFAVITENICIIFYEYLKIIKIIIQSFRITNGRNNLFTIFENILQIVTILKFDLTVPSSIENQLITIIEELIYSVNCRINDSLFFDENVNFNNLTKNDVNFSFVNNDLNQTLFSIFLTIKLNTKQENFMSLVEKSKYNYNLSDKILASYFTTDDFDYLTLKNLSFSFSFMSIDRTNVKSEDIQGLKDCMSFELSNLSNNKLDYFGSIMDMFKKAENYINNNGSTSFYKSGMFSLIFNKLYFLNSMNVIDNVENSKVMFYKLLALVKLLIGEDNSSSYNPNYSLIFFSSGFIDLLWYDHPDYFLTTIEFYSELIKNLKNNHYDVNILYFSNKIKKILKKSIKEHSEFNDDICLYLSKLFEFINHITEISNSRVLPLFAQEIVPYILGFLSYQDDDIYNIIFKDNISKHEIVFLSSFFNMLTSFPDDTMIMISSYLKTERLKCFENNTVEKLLSISNKNTDYLKFRIFYMKMFYRNQFDSSYIIKPNFKIEELVTSSHSMPNIGNILDETKILSNLEILISELKDFKSILSSITNLEAKYKFFNSNIISPMIKAYFQVLYFLNKYSINIKYKLYSILVLFLQCYNHINTYHYDSNYFSKYLNITQSDYNSINIKYNKLLLELQDSKFDLVDFDIFECFKSNFLFLYNFTVVTLKEDSYGNENIIPLKTGKYKPTKEALKKAELRVKNYFEAIEKQRKNEENILILNFFEQNDSSTINLQTKNKIELKKSLFLTLINSMIIPYSDDDSFNEDKKEEPKMFIDYYEKNMILIKKINKIFKKDPRYCQEILEIDIGDNYCGNLIKTINDYIQYYLQYYIIHLNSISSKDLTILKNVTSLIEFNRLLCEDHNLFFQKIAYKYNCHETAISFLHYIMLYNEFINKKCTIVFYFDQLNKEYLNIKDDELGSSNKITIFNPFIFYKLVYKAVYDLLLEMLQGAKIKQVVKFVNYIDYEHEITEITPPIRFIDIKNNKIEENDQDAQSQNKEDQEEEINDQEPQVVTNPFIKETTVVEKKIRSFLALNFETMIELPDNDVKTFMYTNFLKVLILMINSDKEDSKEIQKLDYKQLLNLMMNCYKKICESNNIYTYQHSKLIEYYKIGKLNKDSSFELLINSGLLFFTLASDYKKVEKVVNLKNTLENSTKDKSINSKVSYKRYELYMFLSKLLKNIETVIDQEEEDDEDSEDSEEENTSEFSEAPKNTLKQIYFLIEKDSLYLDERFDINEIHDNAPDDYDDKLVYLIEEANKLKLTQDFRKWVDKKKYLVIFSKIDYFKIQAISVLIILFINISLQWLLVKNNTNNDTFYAIGWPYIINIVHMVLLFILLSIYCYFTYIKECFLDSNKPFAKKIITSIASVFDVTNKKIAPLTWNFTLGILVFISEDLQFLFSVQLFSVFYLFSTMRLAIYAIRLRYKAYIAVFALIIIAIIFSSSISFYFLRHLFPEEDTENYCHNYIHCFFTVLTMGLRNGGGIGDLFKIKAWNDNDYWPVLVFSYIFFFFVILLLLNIINGVIVDTFQNIREDKVNNAYKKKNNCFICNIYRDDFDQQLINFSDHKTKNHNYKNYLLYMIRLLTINVYDHDSYESYIYSQIQKKNTIFFPIKRSIQLENKTKSK